MSLSRKAAKAQDHKIREQLKRMDNIAVALFFAIPLCLALIGGRQLAVWTLPGWYLYSLGYIISFRVVSKKFTTKEGTEIARFTRTYPFHSASWLVFIGFSLFFIIVIVDVMSGAR
ncbi:membrane protein [Yersinia similis]|uniref:hypothetical protein n=1 Tax=Yersinia similis TaxID=367190 RepID=UPI0005E405C3|nr:hypothetical protein [Yersinia similis]CNE65367.1 membrane protein [Yersinia similis]